MSLSLNKQELAKILGGQVTSNDPQKQFDGVQYDSREVKPAELFVALKGEVTHGHTFVEAAFDKGAALALVEDPVWLTKPDFADRCILVTDTLKAFWQMAAWWRRKLDLPVLGITGSVGKSTTKELTAAILQAHSPGNYSLKSHNNHVGVPFTILRTSREHRWLVLEMGMNHAGELRELTKIAEPDVALVTIVAPAHIEYFGSLDAIAQAKCEIFEGLRSKGTCLLNSDDAVLRNAFSANPVYSKLKPGLFGKGAEADVRIVSVKTRGFEGLTVGLAFYGQTLELEVGMLGEHNAVNIAAAVMGAKTLMPQLTPTQIQNGLKTFKPLSMRLNLHTLPGARFLIDDSYNANPVSMRSSIELAAQLAKANKSRLALVLGDMLELGSYTESAHNEIGRLVGELKPEFLIAVGPESKRYVELASRAGVSCEWCPTPEAALEIVKTRNFDIMLVKSSRDVGLMKLSAAMLKQA